MQEKIRIGLLLPCFVCCFLNIHAEACGIHFREYYKITRSRFQLLDPVSQPFPVSLRVFPVDICLEEVKSH